MQINFSDIDSVCKSLREGAEQLALCNAVQKNKALTCVIEELENAKDKIRTKGCDYLIANDISRKDIGFSSDYNEVTIFDKNGGVTKLNRASKTDIARQLFEVIYGQERDRKINRELRTSTIG